MVKSKLTERARLFLVAGEMAGLGAALVILLVFVASSLTGVLIRDGQGAAVITSILADLTNTDRATNNTVTLTVNPTLTAIAQAKANDMALKGYFSHTTPEGHDPWYWFKEGGYLFTYAGENLAIDFSDSAEVEKAWMGSPTHRANILNIHFTEIGIATAVGVYEGRQTTFVVQEFGTPAHVSTQMPVVSPQTVSAPTAATDIAIATTQTKKPSTVATQPSAAPTQGTVNTPRMVLGSSVTGLSSPEQSVSRAPGLTSLWNVFAASPRTTLKFAYYLFGLIILCALVIETGIEFKKHHIRHVVLVALLIVLMGALFLIADRLVFTDPIVGDQAAFMVL